MDNISLISCSINKITLKELCRVLDSKDNRMDTIKIINDYRMPKSNVDRYLQSRFEIKCLQEEKILCKK